MYKAKSPEFCQICLKGLLEQKELPCKLQKCLKPESSRLMCNEDHCRFSCMVCEYDEYDEDEDEDF